MDIAGGCHCGNITFTLHWPEELARIPARRCGCTFCTKHGGVWTSNPRARLRARIQQASRMTRYAFGTETADFIVCTRCGVPPLVTSSIEGSTYAVVNVNTFDDAARGRIEAVAANFEGEEVASRLERRRRHWISDVVIEEVAS